MSDYIPSREADLKAFALNFAGLVTANPDLYAQLPADATAINAEVQEFVAKFDLVQNPPTRTAPNVAAKNAAKQSMLNILRGYAMLIKANRAVLDANKVALGLAAQDFTRTPVAAPGTFPILKIVAATPRRHELRWNDSGTPDLRAKPAGALGLELLCHVGPAAPEDPMASRYKVLITRQPFHMDFALADVGQIAWYYARWQTAKGLTGPWSQRVSMLITG